MESENPYPANRPKVLVINRAIIINSKNKILLVERAEENDYRSGLWELPGGKLDIGETLEENLLREVYEETGLKIKPQKRQHINDLVETSESKYKGFIILTISDLATIDNQRVHLSKEHIDYQWLSADQALKLEKNLTYDTREALDYFISTKQIN